MDNDMKDRDQSYADYGQGNPYRPERFNGGYRNSPGRSGIGVAILMIVFGVLLFLDSTGIYSIRDFWRYWPLLISGSGIMRLAYGKTLSSRMWGGMLIIAGIVGTCKNLGILHWPMGAILSLFVVGVGIVLLVQALEGRAMRAAGGEGFNGGLADTFQTSEDFVRDVVIFSGQKRRITSQDFRGGEIVAIFGGVEMDLRRAGSRTPQSMVIDAVAVFGGIVIRVPDSWRVVMRGTGVFGGYEDKTNSPVPAPGLLIPTLVVTGSAVFGGVSVEYV